MLAKDNEESVDSNGKVTPYSLNRYISKKINSLPAGKGPRQKPLMKSFRDIRKYNKQSKIASRMAKRICCLNLENESARAIDRTKKLVPAVAIHNLNLFNCPAGIFRNTLAPLNASTFDFGRRYSSLAP